MANLIDYKNIIGEWINLHQDTAEIEEAINYNSACISFHKTSNSPFIGISITTNDYVYKFQYNYISYPKYDMSKLDHLSTVNINNDD